jgi:hypothetical protein
MPYQRVCVIGATCAGPLCEVLPRSVPMTSRLSGRCRGNLRLSNVRLDDGARRRIWSNNQYRRCRGCAKRFRRCGRLGRCKVGAQCQQGSGQRRSDRGEVLQDQHWGIALIVREWSLVPNEGDGDQSRWGRRHARLRRRRDRPGGGDRGQGHDCGRSDDLTHERHSLPRGFTKCDRQVGVSDVGEPMRGPIQAM